MLSALHISNIAVIKSCDIEFGKNYNAMTGETGAGKSMVIDAISLLTGSRTMKDIIRAGENSAMVSAYFSDISDVNRSLISEMGVECDEEGGIFVQRDITSDGKSKARINARTVPISLLRGVLRYLINIHGQHDNQMLLCEENHLQLLDAYIGSSLDLSSYKETYNEICKIRKALDTLRIDESEKQRNIDLYNYQLKDIDSAKLKSGEEEKLLERKKKIRNLEKITKNVNLVYRALYHNEKGASASSLIDMATKSISNLSDIMPDASNYIERLDAIQSELSDIAEKCYELKDSDIDNPDSVLDLIESRLDVINRLKRKYGATIDDILSYREKIAGELDEIESSDEKFEEYTKRLLCLTEKATEDAKKITDIRTSAAKKLKSEIESEFRYLDMDKVRFFVEIIPTELNSNGADSVRFIISTNPGELAKPLSKIASGGELARIMLSMKSVFAKKEGTQTLIYDEIDTGISGKTAQKLGFKLKMSARDAQVICVTHSAQVASAADEHLFIEKKQIGDRVETGVRRLNEEERVYEIARIMGGSEITGGLLTSAKELIAQANNV